MFIRILFASIFVLDIFFAMAGLINAQSSSLPSYTASPSAVPVPTGEVDVCSDIVVNRGSGVVPARVNFVVTPTLPGALGYRYHFGDGTLREFGADGAEYTHTYFQPKTFGMWVEVLDAQGNWKSDPSCEREVEVLADQEASREIACLGIELNDVPKDLAEVTYEVGDVIKFAVVAEDNKQEMEQYQISFGDDDEVEQKGNVFLHRYLEEGVYQVETAVKGRGNPDWITDEQACQVELTIVNERRQEPDLEATVAPTDEQQDGGSGGGMSNVSPAVVALAILVMLVGAGMLVWSVRKMR